MIIILVDILIKSEEQKKKIIILMNITTITLQVCGIIYQYINIFDLDN
jgi:hypothetical protein